MSNLNKVNVLRRKITRKLAGNIGRSGGRLQPKILPSQINTILVIRPNHRLGNMLLLTPLLQELVQHFPYCKIDLFVKGGLAPELFKNYEQVNKIIRLPKKPFKELLKYLAVWFTLRNKQYDLVINIDKVSSSGRIATKAAKARYKLFGDENEEGFKGRSDSVHMAKRPVLLLRENMELLSTNTAARIAPLQIRLSPQELEKGRRITRALLPQANKIISIFTYATGDKCYSAQWWEAFFTELRSNYPGYTFLEILPAENISRLNFSIPSFYSLDIREIAAVIASTCFFIGADSGMMHLAEASQTPTFGLFAVTNKDVYEPYNEGSKGIITNGRDAKDIAAEILQYQPAAV